MEVIAPRPPVNHGAVLRQIADRRLAEQPLTWTAIEHELDLPRKELYAYRWLAAARIKAEHPKRTWKAVACDPCVGLKESTLKTGHASAVLATGQTWSEYVGAYQDAMRARLSALQAAEGTRAAEDFFGSVTMLAESLSKLVANHRDHIDNPPPLFGTGLFDKDGIEHELRATEQLVIAYPGMEGEETIDRQRITLAYASKLRQEGEGLSRALKNVGYLLTGKFDSDEKPGERDNYKRQATREEIEAARDELAASLDELGEYEVAA